MMAAAIHPVEQGEVGLAVCLAVLDACSGVVKEVAGNFGVLAVEWTSRRLGEVGVAGK